MATQINEPFPASGSSAELLSVRQQLLDGDLKSLGEIALGNITATIAQGADSIWAIARRPKQGGLAIRLAWTGRRCDVAAYEAVPQGGTIVARGQLGTHRVLFRVAAAGLNQLWYTTELTAEGPLRMEFVPRDIYPLDANDDPMRAQGHVEAAQRGLNCGIVYLRFDDPGAGSVLYFQNLTSLNPYFTATGTRPDGVVGGEWPELGLSLPTPATGGPAPPGPIPADQAVVVSDATIVFRDWAADDETEMARQFLQMLGAAYRSLEPPATEYRDWIGRADATLKDLLDRNGPALERHGGDLFVKPYVNGEVPDLMVQVSLIAALTEWGEWREDAVRLADDLKPGLEQFWDPKVDSFRRFLPDVGDEKDNDEVDSWYFYHPMLNLARLAHRGDQVARDLLLRAVPFAIKAARHFDYCWPIKYRIDTFEVIEPTRNDERFGQTDVGGIYAYVMVQLFELTDEIEYLDEARTAIDRARGMRFDLMYQANLTAWGAVACLRLWRITQDDRYLDQTYPYLASFFYNSLIWESDIANAAQWSTFMGVTCLHDAPYMAMYECFESFAAFDNWLREAGPEVDPAAHLLVGEYCRYALHRAISYFPDALPADILATEHQSGEIDRARSFPLEDLYGDGQAPGQIGQEIYGAGGAFVFAARSHHRIDGAPFMLFCDRFIRRFERIGSNSIAFRFDGGEPLPARLLLRRLARRRMPSVRLIDHDHHAIEPDAIDDDHVEYRLRATAQITLIWSEQ
ncbi:hypothetical protein [Sphingomonas sp.]|uniref:hypothetical protein n=1 Tax=Sphingomonas sp. TaxID=28214 RepID=UPI002D0299FD|nr:hypothetical protein [Sphingomonas sp.]HTG37629.1 hypothetical protein [Sphingomonas sp.]